MQATCHSHAHCQSKVNDETVLIIPDYNYQIEKSSQKKRNLCIFYTIELRSFKPRDIYKYQII